MTPALKERVRYEHADKIADFEKWIEDVRRIDDYQAAKRTRTVSSKPPRAGLSEPSQYANTSSSSNTATSSSTTAPPARPFFKPKPLSSTERDLLRENGGCFKCRRPFAGHLSGECTLNFPTSIFVVDQLYIDSFKKKESKPKPVAALFDRSRGRQESRSGRLSGGHQDRRSASPRRNSSRQPRRSSPSPRRASRSMSRRSRSDRAGHLPSNMHEPRVPLHTNRTTA